MEEYTTIQQDTTQPNARGIFRLPLLQPLANRNFRLLWIGESVSVFGNFFYMIALAWIVLEETGSGLALGTIMMAAAIPRALFMPFGGVLSDRMSPRLVMLASNILCAILVGLLSFLIFSGTVALWHMYLLSIIGGAASAFFLPAMMTMVPRLVSKDKLEPSNSLVIGAQQISGLFGPVAAGFIVAAVGGAAAMGIDAATFVFATFTLLLMRSVNIKTRPAHSDDGSAQPAESKGTFAEIRDGLKYAWGNPLLRAMVPAIAVINFCIVGPIDIGLASLAHDYFGGEASDLGIMLSVFGGSAVLGALLAGLIKVRRRGIIAIIIMAVEGIGLGMLSLAQDVLQASLFLGVMGALMGYINVMLIAWLQGTTRADMLGRVMSLVMFASMGLQPVSLALAGWLVDVGHVYMFVGAGSLILITSFFMMKSQTIRTFE
ncbi:MAG TPA: MFS transporter [Dehalococcoidia bacterium]|nr:MFS transporter [Dehalococcoidia bacterium]